VTGVLVAVLVCAAVGALFDRALFRVPGAGALERAGRALLFGLGLVGSLSMALDAVEIPITRLSLGAAVAALALLLWPGARKRRPAAPGAGARAADDEAGAPRWLTGALLALAAVGLAQALFAAWVRPTFQFDSITRWMFKTQVLAYEHTLRGPVSTDPEFAFTHQRYPPLVCHVANLPALVNGRFDDRLAGSMFPWYMVALVGVVHGALARRAGRLRAAIGAAWVGNLPLLAYVMYPPPGAGAASAMADVPLSLFLAGAALALVDGLEGWRDRAHVEAGLLLGFAALTKNEGLPAIAFAALVVLLCARRARWRTAAGVAGLALLVFWLLWGRLAATFPALDENYTGVIGLTTLAAGHEGPVGLAALVERLPRLPRILKALALEAFSFRSWNLTWLAVPALLLVGRVRRGVVAMLLLAGLQLGAYVFALVITAWTSPAAELAGSDPVDYLMTLTLGRLLVHVAPLCIAAALLACPPLVGRRPGPTPAAG
jgi:hypothetical protein